VRGVKGRHRHVAPEPEPEPEDDAKPKAPLATQGPMSQNYPVGRRPSPDELIRRSLGDRGIWKRIF
jgi:hypothetical protein